jgi:hypothetical protein
VIVTVSTTVTVGERQYESVASEEIDTEEIEVTSVDRGVHHIEMGVNPHQVARDLIRVCADGATAQVMAR